MQFHMKRRFVPAARAGALFAAIALGISLMPSAGDAARDAEIRTRGDNHFVPNAMVQSTLKFTPGKIMVTSGETLTLSHTDQTEEPHTLTIVDAADVPTTIDEVFFCGAPGTVCDEAFNAFPGDLSDGLNERLDSLFVGPGESASAEVTAPPGTTLFFICAIHAWMQGEINVR
jgi:plastocyanin